MAPVVLIDSCRHPVAYDLRGPDAAPLLVLLPSLGISKEMWEPQMMALTGWFRVLRVEHPGHGGEGLTPGPYTAETLGRRVLEVVDSIGGHTFSLVGSSMGGMVAMWIAARYPERVTRLVLCCTAPVIGPADLWNERAGNVRRDGTRPTKQELAGRWFTPRFSAENTVLIDSLHKNFTQIDAEAYALCCELLAEADLRQELPEIKAPTLVIAGALDSVISIQSCTETTLAIKGAALTALADGSHLPNLEQPASFNDLLLRHLIGETMERGNTVRRAVLGEEYVVSQGGNLPREPFEEFMTKVYWGEVWSRPGLDISTRRLLNIAMLTCLKHTDGLAIHVRAALRAGISANTIQEVVLQAAVVAGVPAANAARFVINHVINEEQATRL
ncbi:alpha/beta fold hydrolase [Agrobacterium vitis]|uniref:Alpha/beta fold hydrolase n=1 Tax=Agrobacterium vitis TaxID=373 RepID=A0AAE2UTB1_AGRVI|nr:alpha/beta fold hydrolase [Agrobacterium vitis]MBF2714121.1 alpha/beta fold hydrolase [Agrobacterium vitis]NSY15529.1 alpha/beta fold hydrolase [Agrobacterium vitis]NSY25286.1 alpha/beta fold hydrolase [Agrobacterium vitis]NTA24313.1 alpha/beta fold hydrolase [Agrobacterium vitis]WEO74949.1 alpha/beta fold hydrolase [Agrobacterium vitis]